MTTLADLQPGDAFVLLARVAALDPTAGMTLGFYGPDGTQQGAMVIAPDGTFSGSLQAAPDTVPVQTVPAFRAPSVGDVLQNTTSGETVVAVRVQIQADGTYQFSPSPAGQVWYPLGGWAAVGHVTLGTPPS